MGGHRRDQSDSRMPLRQSEQASFDAAELQVRIESPARTAISYQINGALNQSCTQFTDSVTQNTRTHQRVRNLFAYMGKIEGQNTKFTSIKNMRILCAGKKS